MKKVATIIINRNLPKVTDRLYNSIKRNNPDITDIFVLEAGSDEKNLSKNTTWHVKTKQVKKKGLRYGRGVNYALGKLYEKNFLDNYEAFFLITNDTEISGSGYIKKMMKILNENKKIGILSPCSKNWGEKFLFKKKKLLFFWFIHNNSLFLRKEFILNIMNSKKPHLKNFLFDGNNFRGYGIESELIAKAYMNNWSAAITSDVWSKENETYLLNKNELIKTESYEKNLKLYINEGKQWMKKKYGFTSRWDMQMYVKLFYDKFFEYNPELLKFKI